jgi:DNA-binding transcriptional LysR family regulator
MLTHTQLRQVAALARHGSFRQAAAALRISQPALTKGIQSVETALGVRLFDRSPGPVALTEFGRRVMAHAEAASAADEDLLRDIALMRGLEAGRIDVALGPYPSVLSGWAAAARLSTAHPRLAIALHVAGWREVTNAVVERKADVGVAELSDAVLNDVLATELVGRHRARVFCRPRHPILALRRVTIRDLLQFPWVHTRVPPRVAAAFPRFPWRAGRLDELTGEFVPAIELDVPMQLTAFVQDSDALAFGTLGLVERDLETGRIAVVSTSGFDFRASYGFIYLRNRSLSPGTLAFMQAVRDEEALVAEREARLESIYC